MKTAQNKRFWSWPQEIAYAIQERGDCDQADRSGWPPLFGKKYRIQHTAKNYGIMFEIYFRHNPENPALLMKPEDFIRIMDLHFYMGNMGFQEKALVEKLLFERKR